MWAFATLNGGTFDHVGNLNHPCGQFRPKMWAFSTPWAHSTFDVGGFNLRVGRVDQDTNPNSNRTGNS